MNRQYLVTILLVGLLMLSCKGEPKVSVPEGSPFYTDSGYTPVVEKELADIVKNW